MITKKIEQFVEYGVTFTDEEMGKLNISQGDKFNIKETDDGILLEKYVGIDLELSEFSRELLEFLVTESCKRDVPVSNIMEEAIEFFVKNNNEKI
jgi:hypothetical protein